MASENSEASSNLVLRFPTAGDKGSSFETKGNASVTEHNSVTSDQASGLLKVEN